MKSYFLKTCIIGFGLGLGLTLLDQTRVHAAVTDQAFGNLSTTVGDLRSDLDQLDRDLNARVNITDQNLVHMTGRLTVVEQAQGQGPAQLQQLIATLTARVAALEGAAPPPAPILNPLPPAPVQNPQALQGFLGEIRYSLLSVAEFQRLYGNSWQLLNGNVVHPTDGLYQFLPVQQYGDKHVPDARGRFLRCYNDGRDPQAGNPEGDLPVGKSQNDEFQSHTHVVHDPGHVHPQVVTDHNSRGTGIRNDFNADRSAIYPQGADTIGAFTGITLHNTGDLETRPRCIIVNAFVKVN